MPTNVLRSRRWFAAAACIAIPTAIALIPMQAAFADSSPTTLLGSTTTTLTSKVSGLGLSRFVLPRTTTSKPQSTSRTSSTGSDCSGNLICTDGVTVTLDSSNGPAVGVCSLFIGGSAVQSPTGGCDNGTTTAKGNIALAVGRSNVNLADSKDLVEADTCGIALALDGSNPSTAKVVCGSAPGLGAVNVNQANILALLGPSFVELNNSGDLSGDICGAAAALGLTDTSTNGTVYCQTLSSAQNWQASIPATTLSIGDNLLSADVQKTFVIVNLANPTVAVTVCNIDAQLLGTELPLMPTGKINIDLFSNGPAVNCSQDANLNPIVSNGMVNLAAGDTGAGGGLNQAGGSGGTCGAGGGATQGGNGTASNSCGTSNPPPGYQTVPGPSNGANAAGNIAVVLGQNNANAGPNSGPGGNGNLGAQANACGGSGSGDPSSASAGVKCQNFSYVQTSVKGVTKQKPPAAPPAAAAAPAALAKTGFPLVSGLLGLILVAIGGVETLRRRNEGEASA